MLKGKTSITITALALAILVAGIVITRNFVFDILVVKGPSMSPTIMEKDRILVNKLAYRSHRPERGDIIVFSMESRILIKRVVGLPGDVMQIRDGLLCRNNEAITQKPEMRSRRRTRSILYRPQTVRERRVFVVGDNMPESVDSRYFGTILYQEIIGKAIFIYFPPKRFGKLE